MEVIQIVAISLSVLMVIAIIDLVRRGQLMEKYSLLWIVSACVISIFSVWRDLLHIVSRWLGVFYPPSLLFLLALGFLGLIILHFSVVISKLTEQNKRLGQEVALLWEELKRKGQI
ncbi:MAG: DUF2304 domain-containing protein [Nitrospinota bacterium]